MSLYPVPFLLVVYTQTGQNHNHLCKNWGKQCDMMQSSRRHPLPFDSYHSGSGVELRVAQASRLHRSETVIMNCIVLYVLYDKAPVYRTLWFQGLCVYCCGKGCVSLQTVVI
eukprot:5427751-Amphidinium_carterae.2